jgi:hypothetical protein
VTERRQGEGKAKRQRILSGGSAVTVLRYQNKISKLRQFAAPEGGIFHMQPGAANVIDFQ